MEEQRESPVLWAILKWLSLGALALVLILHLSGGRVSSTPFEQMQEAVCSAASLDTMQEADSQMIRRLYGLNPGDYEGIFLLYPTTNMGAEELLLVKLKETSQQEAVQAAIEARLATQMASFDGYGVEQYAMLEKAAVETRGNYVLLVVAPDTSPVRDAFRQAL